MWKYPCVPMLLLGVAFVNSAPVQDDNIGFENDESTGEYDTYSGYFTYSVNPDLGNNKLDNPLKNDKTSSEEDSITDKLHCPYGQIYQSELSVCINYPRGYLLVPEEHSNSQENALASRKMLSDDPGLITAANKKAQSLGIKLTMVKIDVNHGCKPNENYISELDICVPEATHRDSSSETNQQDSSSEFHQKDTSSEETMLNDTPVKVSASQKKAPSSGTILSIRMIDYNNRCKPSETYLSELDICY